MGKSTTNVPFSIAMLNYQRVLGSGKYAHCTQGTERLHPHSKATKCCERKPSPKLDQSQARNVLRTSWAGQWFTTFKDQVCNKARDCSWCSLLKRNGLCCWGSVGGSKCPSCQSPRNDHQASARPENGRCSRHDLATAAATCHSYPFLISSS